MSYRKAKVAKNKNEEADDDHGHGHGHGVPYVEPEKIIPDLSDPKVTEAM